MFIFTFVFKFTIMGKITLKSVERGSKLNREEVRRVVADVFKDYKSADKKTTTKKSAAGDDKKAA